MLLALRVDVDTLVGLQEGVPRLLELFRRHRIRATFFVSFGPDHSGRAIRRLWRPTFLLKMLRTNPFRLYGLRTLLSGTLLPAVPMGKCAPGLLRSITAEGHELGLHGFSHVRWQDRVARMTKPEVEAELSQAWQGYETALGVKPRSSAAPGWRCTPLTLEVQEGLELLYASDVRGRSLFLPAHNARAFRTLQLPTTLPTLDELLGRCWRINDRLLSLLKDGFNLHTVHAEVEGAAYLPLFEAFLEEIQRRGIATTRLCDIAESVSKEGFEGIPRMPVIRKKIPGRSGWVSCQGE